MYGIINGEKVLNIPTISKKDLEYYKRLCRDRNNGKILTPDGLKFICEAYEYDPDKIETHFMETMARICDLKD